VSERLHKFKSIEEQLEVRRHPDKALSPLLEEDEEMIAEGRLSPIEPSN